MKENVTIIISSSAFLFFMEAVHPFFWRLKLHVTVFNSTAHWAAAFCLQKLAWCGLYFYVQTTVWLPVLGIFNMHKAVDVCDYIRGLCEHGMGVCSESWLWGEKSLAAPQRVCSESWLGPKKNPLLHHRGSAVKADWDKNPLPHNIRSVAKFDWGGNPFATPQRVCSEIWLWEGCWGGGGGRGSIATP